MKLALFRLFLRLFIKPLFSPRVSVRAQRRGFAFIASLLLPVRRVRREQIELGGVRTERATPQAVPGTVMLYLHGGGYCIGSPRTCRAIAGHIARAAGATIYAPDYRLAPEHPHPAALDDALSTYRALLAQGVTSEKLFLGGDSAGGGLAAATAVALREAGLPLPAALVLISPWVDVSCSGETHATMAARDPLLNTSWCKRCAADYVGGRAAEEPLCSPLFADLRGLPPVLIQVGSEEILLADSMRLRERAVAAGAAVTLSEYPGLWHDFQMYAGLLREADQAIEEIAAFMRKQTGEPGRL